MTRLLAALLFLAFPLSVQAGQTVREIIKTDTTFPIYAAVFEVTLDQDAKLTEFQLSKVINPRSGTTDAVDITLPPEYIALARTRIAARQKTPELKDGKPVPFYVYAFYTPSLPKIVIIDLDKDLDHQD